MPVPDRPIRLSRLLLLGLLVAVLHVLVLSWLREQLPKFEPLASMAEPLFTRTLEPTAVLPPTPAKAAPAPAERTKGPLQAASPLDSTLEPTRLPTLEPTAVAPSSPASAASQPVQPVEKSDDIPAKAEAVAQTTPPVVAATPALPEPPEPPPGKLAEAPVQASPADTWPAATRLSYVVTGYYRGDLHGSARVQWQREGAAPAAATTAPPAAPSVPGGPSRYQVQLDLYALGITLFTMTSQGELGAQGLAPKVYEERRPGGVRRVWFEGDNLRLDDGRKVPLPQLAQDTASQFVELGHRFSTGREVLQVGREVAIWLARPGGVDLWTYDVVAEENLRAGNLGTISAFRLKPRPLANPRGNVMAEIWFAPSLQFLPVRVRISMGQEQGNDTFVDLLVERIEQAAK